jgi:hypothetical protein
MLFVVTGQDKPGAHEARRAARPDHLAHWQSLGERLKLAGPFLDENGNPCGSLIIIDVDDGAEANRLANADPYVTSGVFASKSIQRWNWAINPPEGD